MAVKQMFEEEIENLLIQMQGMDVTSDEYYVAVVELDKLYSLKIKTDEIQAKIFETQKSEKISRRQDYIRIGLEVAPILANVLLTLKLAKLVLKFEETGTITSLAGKSLLQSKLKLKY